MKKILIGALAIASLFLSSCGRNVNKPVEEEIIYSNYPENSPVDRFGKLQVKDLQLCDQDGNPVQLAGMSTMGWQWCGECYTQESVETLVREWGISVLRLAMYVEEEGYNTDPEGFRDRMCNLIDICGDYGIYCIVDWHILTPGNPLDPKYAGAEDFFRFIANRYADSDHVIYEICNEPNNCLEKGDTLKPWECTKDTAVTWDMIAEYANTIIPAIHNEYDKVGAPHPIVIVGTPQWDQLVDACLKEGMCQGNGKDLCDSLPPRDARLQFDNVMYAFHFYSKEHNEGFEKDGKSDYYNMYSYMYDVLGKLPVFCSEFGLCAANGDGELDPNRTDKWLLLLSGKNAGEQLVSFCNWSFSDNERSSSALNPGACAAKNWNDLTPSGEYIKKVLSVVNLGKADSSVLKESNVYSK
ncbi:MAG: glycoside hydrolase family 5 protein [Paludibacteraceae bacterium]|nr:glycoside hydrolase family 5 protein [Paludibacteraceae bacterium]